MLEAVPDPTGAGCDRTFRRAAIGAIVAFVLVLALLPLAFSYDWQGRFSPPREGGPRVVAAHLLDSAGDLPRAVALLKQAASPDPTEGKDPVSPNRIEERRAATAYLALIETRRTRAPACVRDVQGELDNPMETRGRNRRLFRLGFCQELLGGRNAAERAYDSSIALKPRVAIVYVHRALLRERRGDLPGAAEDFRMALEIEPDYPPGLLLSGLYHLRRGDRQRAREQAQRLQSIRKPYAELIDSVLAGRLTLPEPSGRGGWP